LQELRHPGVVSICGRPFRARESVGTVVVRGSDAVICLAFDAAGRQPPACMGVRGPEVTSVKVVEIGVEFEVAIGQAARGESLLGSASIRGGVSSGIPSICM
jgi:hypothetical protein